MTKALDRTDPGHPGMSSTGTITATILCLVSIVAFEAMSLSAIMPRIAREFDAVGSYSIAFSAMLTAQLIGIVLAGVWTERSGPVPGLIGGQVLLLAGSLVCAVAPTFVIFIAGRVTAGLGGGILLVLLYVIIGRVYPESRQPRIFSLVSGAFVIPALLGAPVAAWVTITWGWRVVFFLVALPIAITIVAVVNVARTRQGQFEPPVVSPRDHQEHQRALRYGMGVALAAGVLQLATGADNPDRNAGLVATTIVASIIIIAVLTPRLLPPDTTRLARGLPSVIGGRGLIAAAFFGTLTYVPLYLVSQRDLELSAAAVAVSVASLGWTAGAYLQSRVSEMPDRVTLMVRGAVALAISVAVLAVAALLSLPVAIMVVALVGTGVGMGLVATSQSVLSLSMAPEDDHGSTATGLMLSDVLGSTLGIALSGAFFAIAHARGTPDGLAFAAIWSLAVPVALLAAYAASRVNPDDETVALVPDAS